MTGDPHHLTLTLSEKPEGRIRVLDELKGFGILLIILYHAGGVLAWNNRLHGELGVDIFIILSGVGLALSNSRGSLWNFLGRRFSRIYPGYWIALTAFLVANSYLLGRQYTPPDILLHYLGVHALLGDAYAVSINDSFWFITMIMFVYTIYGLARKIIHHTSLLIAIGSAVSLIVTLVYLKLGQGVCFSHFGARLPSFFLGILMGRLIRDGRLDLPLSWTAAISIFVLTYVGYLEGVIFYSTLLGPVVMALYAFGWRKLAPGFVRRPIGAAFAFLGVHSLEIFLLHQPLIREYNFYFQYRWLKIATPSPMSSIVGIAAGLLVTIVLAVLLRWLQGLLLHSSSPRPQAAAA